MPRYEFQVEFEELTEDGPQSLGYYDRLPTKKELIKATRDYLDSLLADPKAGDWYAEKVSDHELREQHKSFKRWRKRPAVSIAFWLGPYDLRSCVFEVSEEIKNWEENH